MGTILYQDLTEKRKSCRECYNYGLCDDLNLSDSNGYLYQLETILNGRFSVDSLGLWNPANNSNPLSASVLVIGQDFSNVGYFNNITTSLDIDQIEYENITNIKLLKYIELTGFDKNEIYFTNAILCIKSGTMNAPIKKKWVSNCSNYFLKSLITQHLLNLKTIITIGKVALDAVREISSFLEKGGFSLVAGKQYDINIDNKNVKLFPMFHTGNLGAVNAAKAKKDPVNLWTAISQPQQNL